MPFTPSVQEQRFVLDQMAGMPALAETERFGGATPDIVEAILEGAQQFAAGELAPLARVGDTQGARWTPEGVVMPEGFPAAYRAYVEGGWGALGVSEDFGGQGLPFSLDLAALETFGTANFGFALLPILTAGAIHALSAHGSQAQKSLYLPKLASGEWSATMNLTEPQAGSDVGALRTRAVARGDGTYAIRGTKIFISFGDHDMADNIIHLVLARIEGAPAGTKGISLFIVPKRRLDANGAPGAGNDVRVVSIEHKMGLHASPTCVMSFGDHDECVGELIGAESGGMAAMFTMMNSARLSVGMEGVQIAEAATQKALAYARDRVQSARAGAGPAPVAIIEHPDVRRMLMRMRAQTQAIRALVFYAAGMVDRRTLGVEGAAARLGLLTPLAKSHATDIGCEVASLGVQVHGGMGYIEETGAAQFFRDARITPIYEGTNGIQAADLVGRKLTADGGTALASLFSDMRADAKAETLLALLSASEKVAERLKGASVDDRLAASTPFLTMLSVAVCGWLLERQSRALGAIPDPAYRAMKAAAIQFYLEQIVPEALGLQAAATASAEALYRIDADTLSA